MCVQPEADYRPLMTDVVQSLIPLAKNSSVSISSSTRFTNQRVSPRYQATPWKLGRNDQFRSPNTLSQLICSFREGLCSSQKRLVVSWPDLSAASERSLMHKKTATPETTMDFAFRALTRRSTIGERPSTGKFWAEGYRMLNSLIFCRQISRAVMYRSMY